MVKKRRSAPMADRSRPESTLPGHGVVGLPALSLSGSVNPFYVGELLLGTKSNIAIRAIKELSGKIYRVASQRVNLIVTDADTRGLSKEDNTAATLTAALIGNDIRSELMLQHRHASLRGDSEHKIEKIPVLEYELLGRWHKEYQVLKKGRLPAICLGETLLPGPLDRILLPDLYPPYGESSGICEGFTPTYLTPLVERLIVDLNDWSQCSPKEKAGLAGAAFALSSAFKSPKLLGCCMSIEPEISQFMKGLRNISGIVEGDDIDPLRLDYGFNANEVLCFAELVDLHQAVRGFASSDADIELISPIRDALDRLEVRATEAAQHKIVEACESFKYLVDGIQHLEELYLAVGRNLLTDKGLRVLRLWVSLLERDGIGEPGPLQLKVVSMAEEFLNSFQSQVIDLLNEFEEIAEMKDEVASSELSWDQQFEKLGRVKELLNGFEVKFSTLLEGMDAAQPPRFDEIKAEQDTLNTAKDSEDLELQEGLQKERELTDLQERCTELSTVLSGRDDQVDSLRKENGELRMRIETFEHAFNHETISNPDAVECRPEVTQAIESVVDELSPASALRVLEALHTDSIRILDNAYASAQDSAHSIPVGPLHQKVKALATDGIRVMRESGRIIDLKNVVPGNLSAHESETVRNSAKLNSLREFRDGCKSRLMYPHFSIDYTNRLYFDYCPEEDRILIGYVGKHLPSAKNATI